MNLRTRDSAEFVVTLLMKQGVTNEAAYPVVYFVHYSSTAINIRLYELQLCFQTQFSYCDLLCHLHKNIKNLKSLCLLYN